MQSSYFFATLLIVLLLVVGIQARSIQGTSRTLTHDRLYDFKEGFLAGVECCNSGIRSEEEAVACLGAAVEKFKKDL